MEEEGTGREELWDEVCNGTATLPAVGPLETFHGAGCRPPRRAGTLFTSHFRVAHESSGAQLVQTAQSFLRLTAEPESVSYWDVVTVGSLELERK